MLLHVAWALVRGWAHVHIVRGRPLVVPSKLATYKRWELGLSSCASWHWRARWNCHEQIVQINNSIQPITYFVRQIRFVLHLPDKAIASLNVWSSVSGSSQGGGVGETTMLAVESWDGWEPHIIIRGLGELLKIKQQCINQYCLA